MISNNDMGTFFSSSIAIGLWLLTAALFLYGPIQSMRAKKGAAQGNQQ